MATFSYDCMDSMAQHKRRSAEDDSSKLCDARQGLRRVAARFMATGAMCKDHVRLERAMMVMLWGVGN